MNHTVVVPDWLFNLANGAHDNWGVVAGTIVTALLIGFVTEYVKHRYTLKQLKKLETLAIHTLLVGLAVASTVLEYAIPFLQTNLRALETLPYIGAYAVGVYAAANYLYALKGKTWYQNLLNTAQKLDKKLNAPVNNFDAPAPTIPTDELIK